MSVVDDVQGRGDEPGVSRRSLLKRAGVVAAVAGGSVVVGAATSGTADAAVGDNLVLGSANSSGTAPTSLTSTAVTPTLTLANTGPSAPLQIAPFGDAFNPATLTGGELINEFGDLKWGLEHDAALVFTEQNAMQLVPIMPVRVLDTRTADGRTLLEPGATEPSGKLKAATWATLHLANLAEFFDAVVGNVTVTGTAAAGYLTLSPLADGIPETSSINYGKNVTQANGITVAVDPTSGDLSIYSQAVTHVILDITAINTPGRDWLLVDPAGTAKAVAATLAVARKRRAARAKNG